MLYPGTNSTILGHPRPDPGTNGAKSSGYKPGSGERTSGGICRGPAVHCTKREMTPERDLVVIFGVRPYSVRLPSIVRPQRTCGDL